MSEEIDQQKVVNAQVDINRAAWMLNEDKVDYAYVKKCAESAIKFLKEAINE